VRYGKVECMILVEGGVSQQVYLGQQSRSRKMKSFPFVEENLDVIRKLGGAAPNVEAQKERGIRMCGRLIGLLHQVRMG